MIHFCQEEASMIVGAVSSLPFVYKMLRSKFLDRKHIKPTVIEDCLCVSHLDELPVNKDITHLTTSDENKDDIEITRGS